MRSAAELSIFLGTTGFVYTSHNDLVLAIRASLISGILVCLGGELCSKLMDNDKEKVRTNIAEADRNIRSISLRDGISFL